MKAYRDQIPDVALNIYQLYIPAQRREDTDKISDIAVLFEFRFGELSHVLPCAFVGDVRSASDNLPPQCYNALALDELRKREIVNIQWCQCIAVRT